MLKLGIREQDLDEQFVRSGGHGGQNVNNGVHLRGPDPPAFGNHGPAVRRTVPGHEPVPGAAAPGGKVGGEVVGSGEPAETRNRKDPAAKAQAQPPGQTEDAGGQASPVRNQGKPAARSGGVKSPAALFRSSATPPLVLNALIAPASRRVSGSPGPYPDRVCFVCRTSRTVAGQFLDGNGLGRNGKPPSHHLFQNVGSK